jgi:hypothetical protein
MQQRGSSSGVGVKVRPTVEPAGMLVPFVDGRLWTCWRPLRFLGVAMGTRMTVCRFGSGALWVHSPVSPDDALYTALRALGPVRWIVAPNRLHHLGVQDFARAFPDAALFASPRLPAHRPDLPFGAVLGDAAEPSWADELDQARVEELRWLDEVVFFDRAARTLILTDLCEEGSAAWPPLSRVVARMLGIYERHGPPRDMKWLLRRRPAATRRLVERILSWDFDRMILAHGRLIESGAKEAFRRAYAFATS